MAHYEPDSQHDRIDAQALLDAVASIAVELHPEREQPSVDLDTRLERDLGLDSLARVELLARLERRFEVSLPEGMFAEADTPRELLRALRGQTGAGGAGTADVSRVASPARGGTTGTPTEARTLVDVLHWHADASPDRDHIRFYSDEDEGEVITFGALYEQARGVAAGLAQQGIGYQTPVALMLPTGRDYFVAFTGVLLAGAIPVALYPPTSRRHIADHLQRVRNILANCGAPMLITEPAIRDMGRWLKPQVETLQTLTTVSELSADPHGLAEPVIGADAIAFLQYTSGTTGAPKGVTLTHANLLANIRAMGRVVAASADDVFVSWLPLYHDMGLIGAWLGSLYYGAQLVIMSPLAFVARPQRWLWALHRYGGTLSAAPNFGYELCLRRLEASDVEGLDLARWRVAFNGAEPVSPQTVERFRERFAPYGLRREALTPVYGLAECAVGLSFPPLERGPVIDAVERETFMQTGEAKPASPQDPSALRFVACGEPLPGHEIRIVDEAHAELPEREQGRIQFRGPSATSGYYHNPEATRALFAGPDGDWLDSGDLGYVAGGELYVTGRVKDLIIRGGRNIYPQEVERAVGDIDGVRSGSVAAFASPDPDTGTERLIVMAETRRQDTDEQRRLTQAINEATSALTGMPPDDVYLAPPNTVLKTSSGKIRRAACRSIYEGGQPARRGRVGQRLELARLWLGGFPPAVRRLRRWLGRWAFATYAWLLYGLLAIPVWTATLVLPRLAWRWSVMRAAGRLAAWATRTPLAVHGLEHFPKEGPCVVVANHASYIDVYVLATVLPRPLRFVAKAELRSNPLIRWPLERIGTEFVERFDRAESAEAGGRLADKARTPLPMVFFPEGTFTRRPGLMAFHMGGFLAAAQAGVPVIPVALRGTRSVLRSGSWRPRRAAISATVTEPIEPPSHSREDPWGAAVTMRDAARRAILRHSGEPDLAGEGWPW